MPAPLQIFLAWCLLLPAFCGIGLAAARLFPGPAERIGWPLAFWLGVAVVGPLLAAWHLFLPVDGRVWILLVPLAAAGLLLERRDLLRLWPGRAPSLLGLAALAFWLSTRAALPGTAADDGLYYTQTVRWNSLYRAVPGLGNLHPFLALNQVFHLMVAALGVGPFHLRGQHLANGLFLLAAIAPCAAALGHILDPRRRPAAADFFAALLFGVTLDATLTGDLSSPAADLAVAMAGTGLLVAALGPALRQQRSGLRRTLAVIAACGGALVVKPSILCIAAPMALFAAAHWLRTGPERRERAQLTFAAALAAVGIATPWVLHSLVLSGYLLYPSPAFALDVDWRMNHATVVSIFRWVHAFARWPGHADAEVAASSAWIGHWFGREWLNDRTFLLPAVLSVAALIALGAAASRRRRPPFGLGAASAAAVLGVALWWTLAPDTRFAGPLLWATAGLLTLAATSALRPALDGAARVALVAGVLAVAYGAFLPSVPLFTWRRDLPPLRHDQGAATARLQSGETVRLSSNNLCWDPPCAWPPLDPALRLRRPGDWSSGLTIAPLPITPLPKASAPAPR